MENLAWLISGGFAKGYRTQVLGVTTALSAVRSGLSATCRSPISWVSFPSRSAGLALLRWAPRWTTPKRPGEPSRQRQNNGSKPRAFMPHSGAFP
jgi:hypothetical protein